MKWLKTLLSRPKRKSISDRLLTGALIQTSSVVDGSWAIWDPQVEEWREWPSERPEPLSRSLEFQHVKRVGAMMLLVYRDIDSAIIGNFVNKKTS